MKKFSLLALCVLLPSLAFAQQGAKAVTPDTGWSKMLAMHFEGIAVTDAQKVRIVAAHNLHHTAMAKLEASGKSDSATKAAIQAHMTAEHADFKKVLSAEQYKTFEANMKKMMAAEGKEHDMKDMPGMKHDMKDMKDSKDMKDMKAMPGMTHDMKDMKAKPDSTKKKP